MPYAKKEWKDRMVENPKTYNIINNSDGTITLEDRPGAVYEEGTPLSAENMNHMEEGIEKAYTSATAYTDNAIAELDTHTGNGTIHITASERKTWNSVTDKHTIKRYKIFPTSIKKDSSVVSTLSIPAGGNSGNITIISPDLSNLKGTIWVDMGWTTADDYALVVTYHCVSTSPSGISMVIWNLGQKNYTLTTTTSFNIIGWE